MDVRDRLSGAVRENQISADFTQADYERLRRENRRLRRQIDVVSGSWIYISSLFLAAFKRAWSTSIRKTLAPCQNALKAKVAGGKLRAARESVSKSALFDTDWYRREAQQAGWQLDGDALEHYLTTGWAAGLSPGPFFDPVYGIASQAKSAQVDSEQGNPLVAYLNRPERKSPSLLFDGNYFKATAIAAGVSTELLNGTADLLSFYLSSPLCENLDCSPLFDSRFYIEAYGFDTDVSTARGAYKYFMSEGRKRLHQPNAFFVPSYYKRHFNSLATVCDSLQILAHYIQNLFPIGARPHPDFDIDFYAAQLKERGLDLSTVAGGNPLLHFLTVGREVGVYPEGQIQRMMADRFGLDAHLRSELEEFEKSNLWLDMNLSTWRRLVDVARGDKKVMLFFGHEASLTGAPMVLLSLVEEFAGKGYDCIVLLARGGAMVGKYQTHSAVGILDSSVGPAFRASAFARFVKANIGADRLAGAIANTVEVSEVQKVFQGYGIESLCLAHEVADSYPEGYFQNVIGASKKVIFSSQFLREQAGRRCDLNATDALVRPQGLIGADREFVLKCQSESESFTQARRYVRDEIGVPQNAFVVLTIGTLDARKGIDLFSQVVSRAAALAEDDREIHFVWIGDGVKKSHSPYYYAVWDINQSGQSARVHFLPPRQPLDPWYMGADVYLLSSRQDPLPCVAQSAMGAGLPVVAFEKSGGIPEFMVDGAGTVVPYGDVAAAAGAIFAYYSNAELRAEHGHASRRMVSRQFDFVDYFNFIEANL